MKEKMEIKPKLIRITTVPLSLDKLLEGQLAFMKNHFDVVAISSDAPYLEKIAKREGVRWKMMPLTRKITPLQDLKSVYLLYRYLKKERPEIVHTHTPKAGIVGMLAARLAGVPHRLHTVAGLPLLESNGLKRGILNFVERMTYHYATRVYPNSHGLKQIILDQKLVLCTKVDVLGGGSSNGINTSYFDPQQFSENDKTNTRERLGVSEDALIFVFVGRMVGDKGLNELVSAFITVASKHEESVLILVGPYETDLDPLNSETLKTIESHHQILTTGYQDDVRAYYAIAKAFVFPSYREGFPNVVMQAGAMGLPSIVTDINGCNEIIKEGYNGLIIPVKSINALKEAMLLIIEVPELTLEMAHNARPEIVMKYEREANMKALLKEYKRLELMYNSI